jgi:hypothetical protein
MASLAGDKMKMLYCSNRCQHQQESPPIVVECKNCLKKVVKQQARAKKTTNHFCSQSCAAKWNNTHKKHGTRVSKLEVWLSQQLPNLYPNLEFCFNRKDTIDSELDIYIPSLKLAFELNGIYHYEPIHGQNKLVSIQSNDKRKFQACLERDIELCIIDVSSLIHFKPNKAYKFLGIISMVINTKLSKN